MPNYGLQPSSAKKATWTASRTLFTILIGINDIEASLGEDGSDKWDEVFAAYAAGADALYGAGARNFLFLYAPPLDLAPHVPSDKKKKLETLVPEWNERTYSMAWNLSRRYTDTSVWIFDTEELFRQVIAEPGAFEQTRGVRDVDGYCEAYLLHPERVVGVGYGEEGCEAYGAYVWRDGLHPVFVMYEVLAAEIAGGMGREDGGRGGGGGKEKVARGGKRKMKAL